MFGIGGFELFLILIFGFLIFGPDKLPAIAQTIGKGIAKFRNAQDKMNEQLKDKSFIDKDSDEPFKNPLEVIEQAASSAQSAKSDQNAQGEDAASDNVATAATKPSVDSDDRAKSFAERKAQYDRQRAERKAAEQAEAAKQKRAEEEAKIAAQRAEVAENPKADLAGKQIVAEED